MEGPDATKAIRALGYKGHIFGCTGNAVMSDQEHFVKCGAKYVPRPPRYPRLLVSFSRLVVHPNPRTNPSVGVQRGADQALQVGDVQQAPQEVPHRRVRGAS